LAPSVKQSPAARRLPVVGVMGSTTHPHEELAVSVGYWLAGQKVHLLTGGGGGVMEAASRGFASNPERKGLILGIIPGTVTGDGWQPKPGYPNPWVEIPIMTHLPLSGEKGEETLSRNHINILTADAVIALPGGHGTASEVRLALRYRRPVIALLHRPADIPGLPSEVPVARALAEVSSWLKTILEQG